MFPQDALKDRVTRFLGRLDLAMMDHVPPTTARALSAHALSSRPSGASRAASVARRLGALTLAAVLPIAGLIAVSATPAAAAPAPIVIDDFSGTTAGPRTVTPLPRPGESTQAPGTFSESGGVATMTMGGTGNRQGGVELDYTLPHLDLTSLGNNTQFFLVFDSIARSGVDGTVPAVQVSISLTGGGVTGVYTTAIASTGEFNIVLNFSCSPNPVCFSPQPDFTDVTDVTVTFLYPQSHEAAANTTTIVLDSINTTPTGGAVPPAASATLTAPADPFYGPSGSTIDFPLQFVSSGTPTRVYSAATAGPLTTADVTVGGTAGGTTSYSLVPDGVGYIVRVGPLTSAGTVEVSVPAGVAVDPWAQPTLASAVASTDFVVPVPPSFTSAAPPSATAGTAYSYAFTAAGIPDPTFSLESGSLPAGLTLGADGLLSGTPAAGSGGSYPLTVRAANSAGDASAPVILVVNQAPAITSAASASFVAGTFRYFTITTSGFPAPSLSVTGALPQGLTFADNGDGTATVSGSALASAAGVVDIAVTAANAAGSAQQTLRLDVSSAPVFTSDLSADLVVGVPASITVTAAGRPVPTIAALDALPAGLTFTDHGDGTGTVSGTPTEAITLETALFAQNAVGATTATLTIAVRQAPAITSADSAIFVVGVAGSFTVTSTGSPSAAIAITSGTLPAGVGFVDNGDGTATLSGTPAAGTGADYPLTISATATGLAPATQAFTLKVKQEPVFTSPATATFVAGQAGSFTVVTEAVPTAWLELVGTLPPGLTFTDNGDGTATIAGTPAVNAVGTYTVTINATNDLVDPPQTLTVVVAAASGSAVPSATGGGLPATGADLPWGPAALAFVMLGAGLVLAIRRRRMS